jgi:hypothetical protein
VQLSFGTSILASALLHSVYAATPNCRHAVSAIYLSVLCGLP